MVTHIAGDWSGMLIDLLNQYFAQISASVGLLTVVVFLLYWIRLQERNRWEEIRWRREDEDRQRDLRQEEMMREEHRRVEEMELRREELQMQRELEMARAGLNERGANSANPDRTNVGLGGGGYIILDLPDEQKALFHDVLKGFEEYAAIRGYRIQFSVDNSLQDKIAFKFTIAEGGINVSTGQVETDLKDYISRVHRGDILDDLPVVIPEPQHEALLLAMRNRINFLQHTYRARENVIEFYQSVLREGGARGYGIVAPQNFYLTGGGGMTTKNYTAHGSQNVAQGEHNQASDNVINQSVRIGQSFNEKKEQLEGLERLIAVLMTGELGLPEVSKRAVINLEKVRDELTSEETPDMGRIKKWLETAKSGLKSLTLGKDLLDLAENVFGKFDLSF